MKRTLAHSLLRIFPVAIVSLALAGCPVTTINVPPGDGGGLPPSEGEPAGDPQAEYDEGFDLGFAEDEEYWNGFDDSFDTVDGGPIFYSGSEIPFVEEPPFEAGFWDGVWTAYNDGYFVAYDYAFTIGFSEGYDATFAPDYADFLAVDVHVEWLDGGFSDGYNDGFSEGRVFGAWDFVEGLPFDWFDAMLDYRSGTDLEIAGVRTGNSGPVILYEWGTDPVDLIEGKSDKSRRSRIDRAAPAIRQTAKTKQDLPPISYRNLTSDVRDRLDKRPETSPREGREVLLESTWLERVERYIKSLKSTNSSAETALPER